MVRFTFLALAGTLLVAIILTERGKRGHIVVVAIVIFFAILVGLEFALQYNENVCALYCRTAPEIQSGPFNNVRTSPAGVCRSTKLQPDENTRNSIAIRQLARKRCALFDPTVGLIRDGLDSFLRFSCIQAHQVHISILQAAVELGWLGGSFFVALMGLAIHGLVPLARTKWSRQVYSLQPGILHLFEYGARAN